jgi:SWI/SNF-related matrix-associated actin-dependent regulator 1 of chromatin subfamily A
MEHWRAVEHFAETTTMTLSAKALRAMEIGRHDEAITPTAAPEAALTLDPRGKMFVYRSGFSMAIRDECRSIPGRRWDGETKTWRFPLSSASYVKALAEKFSSSIGPDAAPYLQVESADAATMRDASRAFDAEVEIPEIGRPLYPYQLAAVRYAQLARWRCVFGDEPGLGKTAAALATVMLAEAWPTVVVCPTVVEMHWMREIAAVTPWRRAYLCRGQSPHVLGDEFDALVVGYPNVHYWLDRLLEVQPRGLVIDELHKLKSKRAQRTMAVKTLAGVGHDRKHRDGSVERIRSIKGSVPHDGLVIGLTGTPFLNDASEMLEPLHILGRLTDLGGWKGYTIRYCGTGPQRLLELHERLRAVAYIRREKAEVLPDLPAKRRTLFEVEGDPKVMREYRKAEASVLDYFREQYARACSEVDERGVASVLGLSSSAYAKANRDDMLDRARQKIMGARYAEHLVQIGTLRQLAAKAKVPAVVDYAEEFRSGTDRPLPIYAHHREVIEQIATRLDGEILYGGQTSEQRNDIIDRFQDGKIPVLVLGIQAAGIGITLTAASDPLFVEQDWNPAGLEQAESRHHRIGQTDSVLVTYMTIPSTIDADMLDLIERKRVIVDAATDGKLDDSEGWSKQALTSVANDLIERMTLRAIGREGETGEQINGEDEASAEGQAVQG